MKIALSLISPDPGQPRKLFDVADLEILANSIRENGLMQAITVRDAGEGRFWIVAGERRYRAHCLLNERRGGGFGEIEAVVSEPPSVADLRVRQIVENIARADLKPLEEAQSYSDLLALGMTAAQAAKRLGVPLARFTSRVSLLNLESGVSKLLAGGQLDAPQALELARLPNHADQTKLLRMINRGEIGQWKSLKAAVDTILGGVTQNDMFGGSPVADEKEVHAVNAMEQRIESLAASLAHGWSKGACIIANKVSPDRAALMADKLAAIRSSVRLMEQELRNVTAQARIALDL